MVKRVRLTRKTKVHPMDDGLVGQGVTSKYRRYGRIRSIPVGGNPVAVCMHTALMTLEQFLPTWSWLRHFTQGHARLHLSRRVRERRGASEIAEWRTIFQVAHR